VNEAKPSVTPAIDSYIPIKPHRGGTKFLKYKVSSLTGFTSMCVAYSQGLRFAPPLPKTCQPYGLNNQCFIPVELTLIYAYELNELR